MSKKKVNPKEADIYKDLDLGLDNNTGFTPLPTTNKKVENTEKGQFRKGGHLVDQTLKYNYPKGDNNQLSIFDNLTEETKREAIENGITVEGAKLSPSESKIIDSLALLLYRSSNTKEPNSKDFYTGNLNPEPIKYGTEIANAPSLGITLYELTKEYIKGDKPSGKDIENVKSILRVLNEKKFLFTLTETTVNRLKNETKKKEIQTVAPLIQIAKIEETITDNTTSVVKSKTSKFQVALHPVFNRQINDKFVLYPEDINKRTMIAYGNSNVSEVTIKLRDWLLRSKSAKTLKPEIMLDKLYYQLAEKWMNESRKSKVREFTEKALKTVKKMDLIKDFKIEPSKTTGEDKIVFYINKDFK